MRTAKDVSNVVKTLVHETHVVSAPRLHHTKQFAARIDIKVVFQTDGLQLVEVERPQTAKNA